MEIGLGFVIGAFAGLVLVGIVFMVVSVSRRAAGFTRRITRKANAAAAPSAAEAPPADDDAGITEVRPGGTKVLGGAKARQTLVIGPEEERESQLNKNIQEVRDLLLSLADVISSTDQASDRAAAAFNSARDIIDAISIEASDELSQAQQLLVKEIDRVLRTNAELQEQLDTANQGIEQQRRQIEELRVAARVDGLTHIPNRAAFDERLEEYLGLLTRAKMLFTLLILDIDFFKRVNDDYGHINGDRILRGVATKISNSIRTNDFAARYGGEEFAVIFPATGAAEARDVAERVRQDIAHTNFRLDDKNVRMTISGGLAEASPGVNAEELIARADQALYRAKNEGRNRIVTAEE